MNIPYTRTYGNIVNRWFVIALVLIMNSVYSQEFVSEYGEIVDRVSQDTISRKLEEYANLGIKEPGTLPLDLALVWIREQYERFGYTDIETNTFMFLGEEEQNLVVTKTGSKFPDEFIIIDAHYDTINGVGANDNGSGTVLLLEIARLLATVETDYSIKFIHFSIEEQGLVGSQFYVDTEVRGGNQDIRVVLNVDEIGGVAGENFDTVTCERDEDDVPSTNNERSAVFTNRLVRHVEIYSNLKTKVDRAFASDYIPFQENGEIITGLFEQEFSPFRHTIDDTFSNMDPVYVYQITKAATGAMLDFASAFGKGFLDVTTIPTEPPVTTPSDFFYYPNPTEDIATLQLPENTGNSYWLRIFDSLGKEVLFQKRQRVGDQKPQVDVSNLSPGLYVLTLEFRAESFTQKIIIR